MARLRVSPGRIRRLPGPGLVTGISSMTPSVLAPSQFFSWFANPTFGCGNQIKLESGRGLAARELRRLWEQDTCPPYTVSIHTSNRSEPPQIVAEIPVIMTFFMLVLPFFGHRVEIHSPRPTFKLRPNVQYVLLARTPGYHLMPPLRKVWAVKNIALKTETATR